MTKTSKQNLKARAHHLNPVIIIGAKGLTTAVLDETNIALEAHELIKIKINAIDKAERMSIATEICESLQAEFIQLIGSIVVIYRERQEA